MKKTFLRCTTLILICLSALTAFNGCGSDDQPANTTTTLPDKGKGSMTFNGETFSNVACLVGYDTLSKNPLAFIKTVSLFAKSTTTGDSVGIIIYNVPSTENGTSGMTNVNGTYTLGKWSEVSSGFITVNNNDITYSDKMGALMIKGTNINDAIFYGSTNTLKYTKTAATSFSISGGIYNLGDSTAAPLQFTGTGTY